MINCAAVVLAVVIGVAYACFAGLPAFDLTNSYAECQKEVGTVRDANDMNAKLAKCREFVAKGKAYQQMLPKQ